MNLQTPQEHSAVVGTRRQVDGVRRQVAQRGLRVPGDAAARLGVAAQLAQADAVGHRPQLAQAAPTSRRQHARVGAERAVRQRPRVAHLQYAQCPINISVTVAKS